MKPVQAAEQAAPASVSALPSAWSPLRNALFRNLWIATIVSNVGTWMQDVGAGWLMTSLSSSPSMVALVEAADSLPVMLLALPAGAIADIIDRRRLLIAGDMLVAGASALYALAALMLAHVQKLGLLAAAMLATGVAWISILSAHQVSAQMTLPALVRARGLAAFVVVFMGGMALGSILWGQVATRTGIPAALTIAAAGMVIAIGLTWKFKLGHHDVLDFTPSLDWPAPVLAEALEPDSGPVMVSIEYRVQPAKRAEFVSAMQAVREMRRRNGAFFWELFHDSADPARFIECFMDESWVEHLRQHERVSVADRDIQRRAKAFLLEGESTKSFHWLADRAS